MGVIVEVEMELAASSGPLAPLVRQPIDPRVPKVWFWARPCESKFTSAACTSYTDTAVVPPPHVSDGVPAQGVEQVVFWIRALAAVFPQRQAFPLPVDAYA